MIEKENYNPATGEQRPVDAYSISAKRYCLTSRPDYAVIIKRSEHGLGHLLLTPSLRCATLCIERAFGSLGPEPAPRLSAASNNRHDSL